MHCHGFFKALLFTVIDATIARVGYVPCLLLLIDATVDIL